MYYGVCMKMSKELEHRINEAIDYAKQNRHEFVTLEHLLLHLTNSTLTNEILAACKADVPKLKNKLRESIKKNCPLLRIRSSATKA